MTTGTWINRVKKWVQSTATDFSSIFMTLRWEEKPKGHNSPLNISCFLFLSYNSLYFYLLWVSQVLYVASSYSSYNSSIYSWVSQVRSLVSYHSLTALLSIYPWVLQVLSLASTLPRMFYLPLSITGPFCCLLPLSYSSSLYLQCTLGVRSSFSSFLSPSYIFFFCLPWVSEMLSVVSCHSFINSFMYSEFFVAHYLVMLPCSSYMSSGFVVGVLQQVKW